MGLFDWLLGNPPIQDEPLVNTLLNPPLIVSDQTRSPVLYRPPSFDEYIGQEKAKTILKAYIQGISSRKKNFPHLLIYGNAGCGKTTLAKIVANELKVNFREILCNKMSNIFELFSVIEELKGGILFLDEVHALGRSLVEPLYPIMEDFVYGQRQFVPFTLIGATTEVGEVIQTKRPFFDRFKIKIELEDYDKEDIKKLIVQYKNKTFPNDIIKESNYNIISVNCRYTPRIGISLLESTIYLNNNIKLALESNNIIKDGYTYKDLKYLEILENYPKGVGINTLASTLLTSATNVSQDIEPYLLKNELILRTKTGRKITEKGKETLKELKVYRYINSEDDLEKNKLKNKVEDDGVNY